MNRNKIFKSLGQLAWLFLLAPIYSEAQCEILKSELESVKKYMTEVSHLSDSLQTFSESAAFAAQFKSARSNAHKVEVLTGLTLNAADEAVLMAIEAQYHSEICGIKEVKSYAIDADRFSTDTRDFAEEAYTNAKKANTAKSLGDIRYYMRKSQLASKEAKKSAIAANYAASDARQSCHHDNAQSISAGSDK